MTLYPNTRPAESWAQCAVGFRNMGTSIRVDRVRLRWPDPPHPGLHSPEVMTEDPTTEPCPEHEPTWKMSGEAVPCGWCGCSTPVGTVTLDGRSFVAWHTLGATIPYGWEARTAIGKWWKVQRGLDSRLPYLVREPLTPPPAPETERDLTPDELSAAVDAAVRVRATPGHGVLLPPSDTYPTGLLVEWLPLDGTDGD
jgi:hypothetical protein